MNVDEKIKQLEMAKDDITSEIYNCRRIKAHKRFGRMTIDEVRDQWNDNKDIRLGMITNIPELMERLGGYDRYEISADMKEVLDRGFDENNDSYTKLQGYFIEYCRPEKHAKKEVKA